MNYFFSVVIPLFNKENFILKTLDSVLKQEFQNFEIIIVNDGSTDKSIEKIKTLKDSRLKLISQENQGVSVARNTGISQAQGQYIALLDADDYWYAHHLSSLKQLIDKFPKAGLYGDRYEILLQQKTSRLSYLPYYIENDPVLIKDYFAESLADPILWTSASAFKKEDFYTIGEFDPKLRTAQDLDFFARGALQFPVAFHPKVGIKYFKDSENNLAKSKYNDDRLYFISKFKNQEKHNKSFKKYLNIFRYALVVRSKMDEDAVWKTVLLELDLNDLNYKQRFLVKLPSQVLKRLKKIQQHLINKGIYLTAFR